MTVTATRDDGTTVEFRLTLELFEVIDKKTDDATGKPILNIDARLCLDPESEAVLGW